MDCPQCGADDMVLYPGETYEEDGEVYTEPDAYECPDCGHFEVV